VVNQSFLAFLLSGTNIEVLVSPICEAQRKRVRSKKRSGTPRFSRVYLIPEKVYEAGCLTVAHVPV